RRYTRSTRDWSSDVCSSDLDLGQLRRRGGNLQFGFPLFNDRYTRLFVSYAIDDQTFTGATTGLASLSCNNCIRSTIGLSVMRDTRIDLPFPTAGTMHSIGLSQSGGPLGGTGNSSAWTSRAAGTPRSRAAAAPAAGSSSSWGS